MTEKFEVIGNWWLPDNPEKTLRGTLTYDPENGAILKVMGSFKTPDDATHFRDYDIINGIAGTEITLFKCFTQSASTSFFDDDAQSVEYFANIVFKGHIFKNSSEIKFHHARANYNHLESWFFHHSISCTHTSDGNMTVATKKTEPVIAIIDENLRISLSSTNITGWVWEVDGMKTTIKEKSFVDFETSTDIDYEQFMNISLKFQQFLTLAINVPIGLRSLSLSVSDDGEKKKSVEVCLFIKRSSRCDDKVIHPTDMPFSFDELSNKFEWILKNWFEKSPLLSPVFNLYFALQYNDKMYVEHRFLNLIACLESYHRRRFDGKYLSDKNYDRFKELIKESLPKIDDDNYQIFKTKFFNGLEYGNELSLRKRLKNIISDNMQIISHYIEDKDTFIEKVIDTRNYRTHFDKKIENFAISDFREYLNYNSKLKILVELCIFKELGFELDEIDVILKRNREYLHLYLYCVPLMRKY